MERKRKKKSMEGDGLFSRGRGKTETCLSLLFSSFSFSPSYRQALKRERREKVFFVRKTKPLQASTTYTFLVCPIIVGGGGKKCSIKSESRDIYFLYQRKFFCQTARRQTWIAFFLFSMLFSESESKKKRLKVLEREHYVHQNFFRSRAAEKIAKLSQKSKRRRRKKKYVEVPQVPLP